MTFLIPFLFSRNTTWPFNSWLMMTGHIDDDIKLGIADTAGVLFLLLQDR
jgi:hypothetical protein